MEDKILFFLSFVKSPKEISSLLPSSRFIVNEILKNIDFSTSKCIVEYGSGTGSITTEILKRASKDTKVLCFEINDAFCNYLKKKIKDKRLLVINDDAANIARHIKKYNLPKVDCVISTLPFSTLGPTKKYTIMKETKKALKNKGKYISFRYFPHFERYLHKYFSKIYFKFIALNLPPSLVYVCEK